jgi:superfamily II DNA or RNA helicase
LRAWVQVLEQTRLFGRDLARVQVLGTDQIHTVALDGLSAQRPVDLAEFSAVAAASRIWRALASDLLLAPLLAKVIPLPHQFRVLRKAMQRFPLRMLLADEVGMGKTIEAGLLLQELKLRGLVERVLVIAPKSLLLQWQAELGQLFGETLHLVLPGDHSPGGQDGMWRNHAQVITSLDAVKPKDRHRGWDKARLDRYNLTRFHDLVEAGWDLVIIDEAHKVAGSSEDVARFQLASELAKVAPHLLLLSATPHSGKGDAFRRLLTLLDPEAFGGGVPLERALVEPYVLRTEKRTSRDANGMPLFAPRVTRLVAVPWLPQHARQELLYQAVSRYAADFHGLGKGHRRGNPLLLVLLQRLVASSTRAVQRYLQARLAFLQEPEATEAGLPLLAGALPDTELDEADLAENLDAAEDLGEHVEIEAARLAPGLQIERGEVERLLSLCSDAERAGPDARAEALAQLMGEQIRLDNEPDKKFLVFTEFTSTQAMLRDFLQARGFAVATLNGAMDLEQRRAAQQQFRDDAQVLIATDAGGEGLNLQFAHVVFSFDLPWAPMRVEQRIGRVDRIGQPREVRAFNLAGENSVEARLYEVWQGKLAAILQEFGVDKSGDVLDSTESEAQFQRLARTALLQPAAFEHELDRAMSELRRAAEKSQQVRQLFTGQLQADDMPPKVPLRAWLATLAGQRQAQLFGPETEDWPTLVRRLQELRPYAPLNQPAPVLDIAKLGFEAQGFWTVWRVGIAQGPWRQHQVFALLHADQGAVHESAGTRLWDALAAGTCSVVAAGEQKSVDATLLSAQAERTAEKLFAQILERTQQLARQRLASLEQSHLRRRQAIASLDDAALRKQREQLLLVEHARQVAPLLETREALPTLDCLACAWVRTR